ncbi:mechanosensitive ion channel family protein [Xiamenia xianingshaonis]|uniref:Mechanosensitive ion channel n=1 Tax=Xiamenia xianingshaonis TaxID=2682776 RepID=A0A9E6SUG6_9ACTN|nr:mechanosensitive ion channel domain-containing protein [Xiamenia xianingshaonis]NHM13435.1 mechanosensitive ion channel [Xiamenia xianingshaonis]QTU84488.1 mechanosensitive ion channel [Xiamenia xianingshaonis]
MNDFWTDLTALVRSDRLAFVVAVVVIVAVTAIVSRLVTRFLRKMLHYNKENNLPSSSIFVNIARAGIWIVGLCVLLSTCFNVNVSAMIAALGVGGIAVSLGFQTTLSNLIAGLQISLMRIVKPGDNITVSNNTGVVKDVNWWNTTIVNPGGNRILVPNSSIVSSVLVHRASANHGSVDVVVTAGGSEIERVSRSIEDAAASAAALVGPVEKAPTISYSAIVADGLKGSIVFAMEQASDVPAAIDAIIRAVSPLVRAESPDEVERVLEESSQIIGQLEDQATDAAAAKAAEGGQEALAASEPLADAGGSVVDRAAAATASTLEAALLGKQTAKRRIAAVLNTWRKGRHHGTPHPQGKGPKKGVK